MVNAEDVGIVNYLNSVVTVCVHKEGGSNFDENLGSDLSEIQQRGDRVVVDVVTTWSGNHGLNK